MGGQTVVLDSSNLDAVIADATGQAPSEPAAEKPAEVPKTDAAPEKEAAREPVTARDDDEPDFAKELGLNKEQHEKITKIFKGAVSKKHRQMKEAEEFAADQYNQLKLAEDRAERLQREVARLQNSERATAKAPAEPQKPNRQDFATDAEYNDAMVEFKVDEKIRQREVQAQQQRERDRMQEIQTQAAERIRHAAELVPDFTEVVEKADVPVPSHIAAYMQESDMLAELGYYFAKNPKVFDSISKFSPAKALVEIGKIESTLTPFSAPKADAAKENKSDADKATPQTAPEPSTTKTRAAAPITPINSASGSQVEKNPRDMNVREAISAWQRDRKVNFSKRQRH